MGPEQAKAFGAYLRQQREERGVSVRQLATGLDIDKTAIIRVEQGLIASPRAELLARIAEYLDLDVADLYGLAGYTHPNALPSFRPYLRAKYSDLPEDAVAQMERYFERLARKYGSTGPASGEDER